MHKIVIFIDTEADPSQILDAALEAAESIASEVGGGIDPDEIWVEDAETAEVLG